MSSGTAATMPELVKPEEIPIEAQLFPTLPRDRCLVQDFNLKTSHLSKDDAQRVEKWVDELMEREARYPLLTMSKELPNASMLTFEEATERLTLEGE